MLFLIILNDAGEAIAQLLMKGGLNKIGISSIALSNLSEFCIKGISSPLIWLGMIVYTVNFFIWIIVLSRIDLSVAVPICSFSYIFVPVLSIIFLGEAVNPLRWIGIFTIILGIYFVSKSTEMTTMPL
jgi:drug/metabolite transporter (DMT)-like permease